MSLPARRTTTLSLRRDLLNEAKALGVNISGAAEAGLIQALKAERARQWQDRNAEAIQQYNLFVQSQTAKRA